MAAFSRGTWDITRNMQVPVVQKVGKAFQRTNHYLVDRCWHNKLR